MQYIISEEHAGMVLREYIRGIIGLSRGALTALKQNPRGILLDGERVTVRAVLRGGDVLTLALEDAESAPTLIPSDLPLEVLYEDDLCVVCSKPPYMPTHPSHGHYDDTLANALAFRYAERGIPFVFRAVNRLDSDTSGAVLVARSRAAAAAYGSDMREGRIGKVYFALLCGIGLPSHGEINAPIARMRESIIFRCVSPDGEPALTRYRLIGTCRVSGEPCTAVLAEPVTGRTHQLRVHFAHIGHPIYGDTLYPVSEERLSALVRRRETGEALPEKVHGGPIGRQALHAALLLFDRYGGASGERGERLCVSAPFPPDIDALLDPDIKEKTNRMIDLCREAGGIFKL